MVPSPPSRIIRENPNGHVPHQPVNEAGVWRWIFISVIAVLVVFCLVIFSPRLIALYYLYWSQESVHDLLYNELGFEDSWSQLVGVIFSFFYALAWIPLLGWTVRVLTWKFSARQFAVALASWLLVYGHSPLAHALLGSNVCFNQASGEPLKWYVVRRDGELILFDSPGYDPALGEEKRPVTNEVCDIYRRQKQDIRPKQIQAETAEQIANLFDPSGSPRAWYFKQADGTFELYDAPGFHPVTRELLLPITKPIQRELLDATQKRTTNLKEWASQDKDRLNKLLGTCSSVPSDVIRLIWLPTELATERIGDFDLRSYISGSSGIAVMPSQMALDALDNSRLVVYNEKPELSTHGPEIFLQLQNAKTQDPFMVGASAIFGAKQDKHPLSVFRVSIISAYDLAKRDSEEIRFRLVGKNPNATQWNTFGVGLNGKCYILAFVVL